MLNDYSRRNHTERCSPHNHPDLHKPAAMDICRRFLRARDYLVGSRGRNRDHPGERRIHKLDQHGNAVLPNGIRLWRCDPYEGPACTRDLFAPDRHRLVHLQRTHPA